MLTISPFLVIDDNTNINNERARKIRHKQTQKKRESKNSAAQTKSIDMSQKLSMLK
jgi:hypothetical protein